MCVCLCAVTLLNVIFHILFIHHEGTKYMYMLKQLKDIYKIQNRPTLLKTSNICVQHYMHNYIFIKKYTHTYKGLHVIDTSKSESGPYFIYPS